MGLLRRQLGRPRKRRAVVSRTPTPSRKKLEERFGGWTELPVGSGKLHSISCEPVLCLLGPTSPVCEGLRSLHAHSRDHHSRSVHAVLLQTPDHKTTGSTGLSARVGDHH